MQPAPPTPEPDPLGKRYRAYQPAVVSIVAGFIFGALLIVGGVVLIGFCWFGAYSDHFDLPFYEQHGWSWLAVAIATLVGGAMIYFGWIFVISSRELVGFSVELREQGFRVRSSGVGEQVLWSDVQRIRQLTLFQRKLASSSMVGTYYTVVLKNGKEHEFGRMSVRGIDEFVKILREVARRNSIPWETVEEHV